MTWIRRYEHKKAYFQNVSWSKLCIYIWLCCVLLLHEVRSYYAVIALPHCILLHRNCDFTALQCRMKVKFILTWNAVKLRWLATESNGYIGTATQLRCSMNGPKDYCRDANPPYLIGGCNFENLSIFCLNPPYFLDVNVGISAVLNLSSMIICMIIAFISQWNDFSLIPLEMCFLQENSK